MRFWKNGAVLRFQQANAPAKIVFEPLNRKIKIEITGKNNYDALKSYIGDLTSNPKPVKTGNSKPDKRP